MDVTSLRPFSPVYRNDKMSSKPEHTKEEVNDSAAAKDSYVHSDRPDRRATYGRPHVRKDDVGVQNLNDQSNDIFDSLKNMVMDQIRKQVGSNGQFQGNVTGDFSFDEQTQIQAQSSNTSGGGNGQANSSYVINEQTHVEVHFSITSSSQSGQNRHVRHSGNNVETPADAQAAIAPGGDYSPENVSDNILKFAKAISGGDKSKLDKLKAAIEEGFKKAKEMLGGKLPDACEQTYKLVNEKLDKWAKESDQDAAQSTVQDAAQNAMQNAFQDAAQNVTPNTAQSTAQNVTKSVTISAERIEIKGEVSGAVESQT